MMLNKAGFRLLSAARKGLTAGRGNLGGRDGRAGLFNWSCTCVLALLFLLLAGCQEVTTGRTAYLAHGLPTSHPVHQGMEVFAQRVAELSDGQLAVKIFPDGQLGSEREVLELLQIGSLAMTKVSAAAMANFAPEYQVLGVPYLFRDSDHLFAVLEGPIGQRILKAGDEFLLRGLCFYDAGGRSFYTKDRPIRTPEDLEGLKIRVMSHQMSVDMVNAMGGSATPMSYGELYTALQQGVVDGAENNPPSLVTSGHYEVCKYYTLDEHALIPDVLVIGTRFWETLSGQEQLWMKTAAEESLVAQKQFWRENVAECMETLTAAGVEIIRPDKRLFAKRTQSVLNDFADDERTKQLVAEIQAQ